MVVLMTHDITHTTVLHEHSDALEDFPNVAIELLPVICSLLESAEEVELGALLGILVLPYFQGLLNIWTVFPVVEGKNKVTVVLGA